MQQAKQISRIRRKDKADILDEYVVANKQLRDKRNKPHRFKPAKRTWVDMEVGTTGFR